MLRPLRRKIREVDTDGMTKAERKRARQVATHLKHQEASRLIRILEDGREVETVSPSPGSYPRFCWGFNRHPSLVE